MGYCHSCGRFGDIDHATKMCGPCRRDWRPATPPPGDLGHRNPHASARSAGQSADLPLHDLHITFPQVSASSRLSLGQASGDL